MLKRKTALPHLQMFPLKCHDCEPIPPLPPQLSHKKHPLKETRRARVFAITNDDDEEEDASRPAAWEGQDGMAPLSPLGLWSCDLATMWPCPLALSPPAGWAALTPPPPAGEGRETSCALCLFLFFSCPSVVCSFHVIPFFASFVFPGVFGSVLMKCSSVHAVGLWDRHSHSERAEYLLSIVN